MTNNNTPVTTIYDTSKTEFNPYQGGPLQQAASALTYIDNQNWNNSGYAPYGFEWWSNPKSRDEGYITWFSEGHKAWTMTSASMGPDSTTQVSQRLISEEPHVSWIHRSIDARLIDFQYIIMNLGMSPGFQAQDYMHMQFPAKMYIDYVRVYQREDVDEDALSCDPKSHPTAKYINKWALHASSTRIMSLTSM
jgi:beta-glucan synthesis-associated protein KRE6